MTSLAPLLQASPVIQIHAGAAILALLLGPLAIFRPRRDRLHRVLGYLWILAMAATAISSFWIHTLPLVGPFGPIHALSIWALISLFRGLRAAIRRDIAVHRGIMRGLYFYGIGAAGIFTLLPGRVMHRVLFGTDSVSGFVLIGALLVAAVVVVTMQRLRLRRRNA